MRKISKYFGLAALLFSLVSCQDFKESIIAKKTINVSFATSVDDSQTKVSIERDENSTFITKWDKGDKITVKYGSFADVEAIWDADGEVFNADLDESAQTVEYTYNAVYPVLDKNSIAFGSERSQIGNNFNGAYDVMLSKPVVTKVEDGSTVHFEMKRQTAIQYFKFVSKELGDIASEKIESATLTLTGDKANIAGSFIWAEGALSPVDTAKSIKITFDPETAPTADSVVLWFNVIPAEYESLSLELATKHHKINITNSKSGSYVAEKLYKTELDLSASPFISKWEEIPPKTFVENFSSKNATKNNYDCDSKLSTEDNRKDFDYVWTIDGNGTVFNNGIKLGASSSSGSVTNSTILESIENGSNFTIKVYAAVWNKDGGKVSVTYNDKELTLSAANDAITSTSSEYKAADFAKATSFVFNKAKDVNEFTVASSSKRILIDKIEVVEGGELPEPFSVSTESLTPKWDDTEATFDIVAGDKVNWEIVADEGLTLSQDSGTGNATITVTFDQNTAEEQVEKTILVGTDYPSLEGESEYEISFIQAGKPAIDLDGDGTVENPYSVADALYLIGKLSDNGTSASEVFVKGTIVGDDAGIDTKYGNATFDIIDSGISDDTLNVFRVKDLSATAEGASFTATDQLSVGDEVVVFAKLKKYVTDSKVTPETNEGKLYSINGKTYILTGISLGEKKTVYYTGDEFVKPAVTASYRGKSAAVITDATVFSGYDLSVKGQQTVTASYTENGMSKTEEYSITVNDGTDAENPEEITTGAQTSFDAVSGNSINGDSNISYAAAKGDGTTNPAINSNKIRLYKPSSGKSTGGVLTLTAQNGAKITGVIINTSRNNSFVITADGVEKTGTYSGSSSPYTVTISELDASSVSFTNIVSDSNDISYIDVTYYGGKKIVCVPLASPSGLSCTAQTSTSLTFKWTAVDNASGYKVSKDGGITYGETQTATTYTWTGLEAESLHTLYVKAVGDGKFYSDSDPVSAQGTTAASGSSESVVESLDNEKIVSLSETAALAYKTETKTNTGTIDWSIFGYTDNKSRPWIQLKKDKGVYFKISAPCAIQKVVVTITSSSNSSGGITDISKHTDYSGYVKLMTADAEASTDKQTNDVASSSSVSNDKVTLEPTGDNTELYLKVTSSARIWSVEVTY